MCWAARQKLFRYFEGEWCTYIVSKLLKCIESYVHVDELNCILFCNFLFRLRAKESLKLKGDDEFH